MTRTLVAVETFEEIASVAEIMLEKNVHRVLVYEEGRLVGIVTSFDMLRAVVEFAEK